MADLLSDIVVIGAGVLGLSVAAELTTRGHQVRVVDPGRLNASTVAAGMIAPAFESLLDRVDGERAVLLRDASDLWPTFAARTGIMLDVAPAEWRGADAAGVASALTALGFAVERDGDVVRAGCDLRIDPERALASLIRGLSQPVLKAGAQGLARTETGWRIVTSGGVVDAKEVVLATGAAEALSGLPEGVAALVRAIEPVAGQIGTIGSRLSDRVIRGVGGYVAPRGEGVVVGATMVHGSRDTQPDPEASARLTEVASRLTGTTISAPIDWRGGVRGATADGLPLAGDVGEGLHVALAPRRNGWLLGPLVARIVADAIDGRPRGSHAAALDPLRFSLQAS